jgi:hypothetical protein
MRNFVEMPFFLIAPVWLLCVVAGGIMLFVRRLRKIGYFVMAVSTGATLASFRLSTFVLFVFPRLSFLSHMHWAGIAVLSSYAIALVLGAVLGLLLRSGSPSSCSSGRHV